MTATAPRPLIEFSEGSHTYRLNGDAVPSVTTVLSAEGLSGSPWFTEAARNRGTAVHKIALLLSKREIRGHTPEEIVANSLWDPAPPATGRRGTHPALVPYGYGLAKYFAESGFRPNIVETAVASPRFKIAGTLDAFGTLPNGQSLLVDYKSGNPQKAAWLQIALYAALLEETYSIKPDLRTVVWLKPDGTYQTWEPRPVGGQDLAIAQMAVNLYHWRAANRMLG